MLVFGCGSGFLVCWWEAADAVVSYLLGGPFHKARCRASVPQVSRFNCLRPNKKITQQETSGTESPIP